MSIENIMVLLNAYGGLDYFVQVTLFVFAVVALMLPIAIIVSLLGTIRTLAEGFACLVSFGTWANYSLMSEKREAFLSPLSFLKSLLAKKEVEEGIKTGN